MMNDQYPVDINWDPETKTFTASLDTFVVLVPTVGATKQFVDDLVSRMKDSGYVLDDQTFEATTCTIVKVKIQENAPDTGDQK
jgi:hypothetical protein